MHCNDMFVEWKNGLLNGSFIDSFEWNLCWKKISKKSLSPRPYPRIINVESLGILWASGWFWWRVCGVETRWPPQSSCPMWPLLESPAWELRHLCSVPHTDILGHLELECDWVGYCPLVCASPHPCQSSRWFSGFTVSVDGTPLLHCQGLFVAEQAWFYTQGTFRETKPHRQIMTLRSEIGYGLRSYSWKVLSWFFISEEMKASDKLHHLAYGFSYEGDTIYNLSEMRTSASESWSCLCQKIHRLVFYYWDQM